MSWKEILLRKATTTLIFILIIFFWATSLISSTEGLETFNLTLNSTEPNILYTYEIVNSTENVSKIHSPPPPPKRLCAYMNVSHNSSYEIYDREEESKGLEYIHNTKSVYEEFLAINVEPGCEATICELVLLDPVERTRKCYNLNGYYDFARDSKDSPDPATKNYIVSSGCSCKIPYKGCDTSYCHDVSLREGECARLYKETFCSECRYDSISIKEEEVFTPKNGFWCQSYIIRDGCRLGISNIATGNDDGMTRVFKNVRNYTGIAHNVSLNYVRKPAPSTFSCFCDVISEEFSKPSQGGYIMIIILSVISVIFVSLVGLVLRICIRIRIEKKISRDQFEGLIHRFRHGFSKDEADCLTEDGQNPYVSAGRLTAIQQPYQHKWEINRDDIIVDKTKLLGSGEFGCVYLSLLKNKDGENNVAAKVPRLVNISCLNSVLEEIKTLAWIGSNPNICKLIGACTEDIPNKEVFIILEHCSEGNLKQYLKRNKSSFMETSVSPNSNIHYVSLSTAGYATVHSLNTLSANSKLKVDKLALLLRWATQIASGMEFLSSKQVIHIDLAARNVFLDVELVAKIGDFGLSQRLKELVNYVRVSDEYPLPFRWMSLESLTDFKFTSFSDVWSFGIILSEIFSLGDDPYPKVCGLSELVRMLKSGQRCERPFYCSDEIYQIMLRCWDIDPQNRPDFSQIKILFQAFCNNNN